MAIRNEDSVRNCLFNFYLSKGLTGHGYFTAFSKRSKKKSMDTHAMKLNTHYLIVLCGSHCELK